MAEHIWRPPDLAQPEKGYRFTTDSFLLASFASGFPIGQWCDLGTGSGVIASVLAERFPQSRGYAVERLPSLLTYARTNLRPRSVTLIESDLRSFPWRKDFFDVITCNPPFYEVHAGQINQCPERAAARHTFFGTVCDFFDAMAETLTPRGVFCFVFPYHLHHKPLAKLLKCGWSLIRTLNVRSFEDREPKLICLALARSSFCAEIHQNLVLYRAHRAFTEETEYFLRDAHFPLERNPAKM